MYVCNPYGGECVHWGVTDWWVGGQTRASADNQPAVRKRWVSDRARHTVD